MTAAASHSPAIAIPRRHGCDIETGRKLAGPLKLFLLGQDPEPSQAQWQAMGESLLAGDPLADQLVDWMHSAGMAEAMPLFRQAQQHGLSSVKNPPTPLVTFFEAVERTPEWVDWELLEEGSRVCQMCGLTGLRALRDMGLMAGYQASAINRTLVLTGALNGGAQRRLAETTKWWIDCTGSGGMRPQAVGYQSTLHVRMIHGLVRKRVSQMPEWDTAEHGLPINQGDMNATYLAFSVIFLFGSRLLGVPLSKADGQAVMHLWRYISWLIGVDEQWLLSTETEGRIALYQNLLAQAPPDSSSLELGSALRDEPLDRHYAKLPWLQGRYQKAMHISIARAFLSSESLKSLGLPTRALPWFPIASFPIVNAWHRGQKLTPRGRDRLVKMGRKAQMDYLPTLFGAAKPDVKALD